MIRTITDGIGRIFRAAMDPDYDPDEEVRAQAQLELQMAMIRLAVELIRAQRDAEEDR